MDVRGVSGDDVGYYAFETRRVLREIVAFELFVAFGIFGWLRVFVALKTFTFKLSWNVLVAHSAGTQPHLRQPHLGL